MIWREFTTLTLMTVPTLGWGAAAPVLQYAKRSAFTLQFVGVAVGQRRDAKSHVAKNLHLRTTKSKADEWTE